MAKIHMFLAAVAMALGVVSAITDAERNALNEVVTPIIAYCGYKFGITPQQAFFAKSTRNIDALNPCYYACFYKKIGFITEDGFFNPNAALASNRKFIKGEDDLRVLTDISRTCNFVNQIAVSDGMGCERAKLLLSCFIKEKAYSYRLSPFKYFTIE